MKVFTGERSNIFLSWLISYAMVLLSILLLTGIVYFFAVKVIEDEINRANMASLKQLQQNLDSHLADIEKLSVNIAWNERLNTLIAARGPLRPFHQYVIYSFEKELRTIKAVNNFIGEFFIYFKNNDYILSGSGKLSSEEYYRTRKHDWISYEDWKGMLEARHEKDYHLAEQVQSNGRKEKIIEFSQSFPIQSSDQTDATLMVRIDGGKLQQVVEGMKWLAQGMVVILDRKNGMVASTQSDSAYPNIRLDLLTDPLWVSGSSLVYGDFIISQVDSGINEWRYISVLPRAVYLEKAKNIKLLMGASILLCFIIGCITAYISALKNYRPIRNLSNIILKFLHHDRVQKSDEYSFIEKSVVQIIAEYKSVTKELNQQKSILKNHFLVRLIKGQINKNLALEDVCASHGIRFESERFLIMLLYVEDYSTMFFGECAGEPEENIKIANFIIRNVVEELVNEKNLGYVVEVDGFPVCLINVKVEESAVRGCMLEIAEKAGSVIETEFGLRFTVAISGVHKTCFGISTCYKEAVETMDCRLTLGDDRGQIICYEELEVPHELQAYNTYSLEVQQQFLNCIRARDIDEARDLMNRVIHDVFHGSQMSLDMAKCLMFAMIHTMINAVREISVSVEDDFLERLDPVNRLLRCNTVQMMKSQMNGILGEVSEYIKNREAEESDKLIEEIMEYIHANFHDCNLSVSSIADQFNYKIPFISKFFKKHTGEGLLDYINRVRLSRAKDLLQDGHTNIKVIAGLVGYVGSNAFIRTFKRYEGITPGKYKEMTQKG